MATRLQVTVDCADPGRLVAFWAEALGYVPAPPPEGFADWSAYYRSIGVPESELPEDGDLTDSVVDPNGLGPRLWFQQVPEHKTGKNRLHLDLRVTDGRRKPLATRRRQVDAEVARLLAAGADILHTLDTEGLDHYAVVMRDPEGNEFCVC